MRNYKHFRLILESLYLTVKVGSKININNFKYSLINTLDKDTFKIPFNQLQTSYNVLHSLGIIKIIEPNALVKAEIIVDKKNALNKYDEYYKLILNSHK